MGEFIGREALLAERESGPRWILSCLVVDDAGADAHGHEPIYAPGAERPVAYVASGGYGHTLERSLALAYLRPEQAEAGTALEVGILGERRPARVVEQPLYDPRAERLLS
jgi:dimethylglycine dehydrogenase